jgi:Mg-chelatase subunit ChlD
MTVVDAGDPGRFKMLASALARRSVAVVSLPGEAAHTDGLRVFVTAGSPLEEQRRQVILQAALLGSGSLDDALVKRLRTRPKVAGRYLALEGRRVLARLPGRIASIPTLAEAGDPLTASATESLDVAEGRQPVPGPPDWFGQIRPSYLLGKAPPAAGTRPSVTDLKLALTPNALPEADEDDTELAVESTLLKLFQHPLSKSKAVSSFLAKLLGTSRSLSLTDAGGGVLPVGALRSVESVGPDARPAPVPFRFGNDDAPGAAGRLGGSLYPEWDVHKQQYRPEWCRVIELPVGSASDVTAGGVERDEVLRRRLARLGLGPQVLRRRPDGDDVDVDALIDLAVDLHTGQSPAEAIYLERRLLARNLGVLILVDASGSATETDLHGQSVHEHQRRAAATLAVTLEELGDRVAVYGFRSRGRADVHLLALKPFATRFGAGGRAQLNRLEPAGYTRLGAAIRHAGELLKTECGTPHRLLLVLSDGFPYDEGYESRYAEADARRALEELRTDGLACLCLSVGASTPTDALDRVFGSASHANAPLLGDLSPRMDELFLSALKELAAPNPRARRRH